MKKNTKTQKFGTDKVVYFGGSFEIISWGHCKSFKLARSLGEYVIIGLNTDKLIKSYKHREPLYPYYQKKFVLESLIWIDKVIPVCDFSPMKILKRLKPDVYLIGSEFVKTHKKEIDFVKSYGGKVKVSPEWKGVLHTSDIKKVLLKEAKAGI